MNKQERAIFVHKTLDKYFPDPKIPLDHKDTYTLLIAVLLSAQCTDKKVNEITPLLFKQADTPEAMALLSQEEIASIIKPIGLTAAKSKAIKELSKLLISKFNSQVPNTLEELTSLPGVGNKTASVILCQAFRIPAFPVDTHIHRCAQRWKLSSGKSVTQTEKDLKKLFPKKSWIKLHLQIIYFARKFCPAKKHSVDTCPICSKF